jgi:hypothetical protein
VGREPSAQPADVRDAAAATWHLAHGAHLAACLAVLGARGRQAVVQRDAGAVLSALIVCGLEPHWLAPAGPHVTPAALDAGLDAAPGARAALLACGEPDVAALVEVAHGHGAALVLDATSLPEAAAAIAAGADLVIVAPGARRRGPRAGASLLLGPEAERWLPAAAIERAVALAAGRAGALAPVVPASAPPSAEPRRFVRSLPRIAPGPTVCTPRAAWLAPQERVAPAAAVGRIAAEALTPDPPGVPAVLPGERIVPDVVATLRAVLDAGGVVHGALDGLATLAVVAEPGR